MSPGYHVAPAPAGRIGSAALLVVCVLVAAAPLAAVAVEPFSGLVLVVLVGVFVAFTASARARLTN